MQIFIKNQITQKIIALDNLEHSHTIDDIKKKITESIGTSPAQHGLSTSAGTYHLEGNRELWEYNIQDGSTLELYFLLSVPIPVLSVLSKSSHNVVTDDVVIESDEEGDQVLADDEFEIPEFGLTHDELEVSNRGRNKLLKKEVSLRLGDILGTAAVDDDDDDDYDPVFHQSLVEDKLNKELVSLISVDDSEYSDDDDDNDDINYEIKELDAVNDASWGLVADWY